MNNDYEELEKIRESYRERLSEPSVSTDLHKEYPPLSKIIEVRDFTLRHLHDFQMSVEWIYEQCGIIEREFAARFKLYFGHYPKSYYVHHRIEVSKLMLTQTEALVTEVALMVGFDTSNFCKAFKRKVGMTPTEWREWR